MITISKPLLGEGEIKAVKKVLNSGFLASGEEVKKFETDFAKYVGTKFAIATNSGTSALHTALSSIGVKEGDEVITTTFSFIATASCILMQRAKPILCDIDPKTYNISPYEIEKRITKKTKAIIVVHLYGQPCDMGPILDIAEDNGLFIIEDACQAHGAEYNGKKVGSLGNIGCFSFYPTKNMTTGEGGMITTNDEEIAKKVRMIINHGRKDRYLHGMLGYNYRMTEIAAAIGRVQLKKLDAFNKKRINNARFYDEELDCVDVEKPYVADCVKHVYHQYTIRVKTRDRFIKYLGKNGIGYGIYYPIPINKQPLFEGYKVVLPNAENASREVVSIPVHPALSESELKKVAGVVNDYGRG